MFWGKEAWKHGGLGCRTELMYLHMAETYTWIVGIENIKKTNKQKHQKNTLDKWEILKDLPK